MGPIVAGVVNGCMGIFYPFDKGFTAVKDGTPWPIQGAIFASLFYQVTVFDKKGAIGLTIRLVIFLTSRITVDAFHFALNSRRSVIGEWSDNDARVVVWFIWIFFGYQHVCNHFLK